MIKSSELMLNADGSIYHLHLCPSDVADDVILVGDPGRVSLIATFFSHIDLEKTNREFHTITGWYKGKRMTLLSTGIGTDNIDIVMNELDALVNVDFETGKEKPEKRTLNLVRVGTSGSIDGNIPLGSYVISRKSIGMDGLMNFYAGSSAFCDVDFEKALTEHMQWHERFAKPYVIDCSEELMQRITSSRVVEGVNVSAPGFYAPQGRVLRLPLEDPLMNERFESFEYKGFKISNFEMESSAIYGFSKLLGHRALTICLIIANRVTKDAIVNYLPDMKMLVSYVLDKLVNIDNAETE